MNGIWTIGKPESHSKRSTRPQFSLSRGKLCDLKHCLSFQGHSVDPTCEMMGLGLTDYFQTSLIAALGIS